MLVMSVSSSRKKVGALRSEEHTSELQSRTLISYAVFCLKKKKREEDDACQARGEISMHNFGREFNGGNCGLVVYDLSFIFFFNDTATTEIYTSVHTLSLHDALPISWPRTAARVPGAPRAQSTAT